jgi:hypothetical protein
VHGWKMQNSACYVELCVAVPFLLVLSDAPNGNINSSRGRKIASSISWERGQRTHPYSAFLESYFGFDP